ncbi:MAG: site-specific integrase [Acidimicrobiales bacterium]
MAAATGAHRSELVALRWCDVDLDAGRVTISRGVVTGPDAYLFSAEVDAGTPWHPDSASRSFARLCRRTGVTGIRLHDLRHFVATRLLSAGADVRTVAGRLGHRNAAITLNVYSHFLAEADRDAADLLGRLLDEPVGAGRTAG